MLTSVVKDPQQIFLNYIFSGSFYTKISCPAGISAGFSNQTYFRFWSGVGDTPNTGPGLLIGHTLTPGSFSRIFVKGSGEWAV